MFVLLAAQLRSPSTSHVAGRAKYSTLEAESRDEPLRHGLKDNALQPGIRNECDVRCKSGLPMKPVAQ